LTGAAEFETVGPTERNENNMALQDLTPQLRTRLNRMERAVGWFVLVALVMMIVGFVYFLHNTAKRRGWFLQKITYQTCVSSGAGLKVGDPVKLMGFDVGELTAIIPNAPSEYYNITILFRVKLDEYNYPGYIWSDSKVRVNAGDLLGGRFLEITKGTDGLPTILQPTNNTTTGVLLRKVMEELPRQRLKELKLRDAAEAQQAGTPPSPDDQLLARILGEMNTDARAHPATYYTNDFRNNIYWLEPLESPAVTERLDQLVTQVEKALPNILSLTNKIGSVLDNSANLASNLNVVALDAQPASSDLAQLAAQLRRPGALGEWALGTNGQRNLDSALANANTTIANTDTNLTLLVENLARSLDNLADITSNLNAQVQANTNMLGSISKAVVDADDLVQGLKRHWLLRSAFREKPSQSTNAPTPLHSPRGREQW
jgi:ABC-type transporter Mla subunit MlaD